MWCYHLNKTSLIDLSIVLLIFRGFIKKKLNCFFLGGGLGTSLGTTHSSLGLNEGHQEPCLSLWTTHVQTYNCTYLYNYLSLRRF